MTSSRRTPVVAIAVGAVLAILTTGCERDAGADPAAAREPPARVVREGDLNTVTLTASARERLGIETAAVERRPVARARTLGGTAMAPPGLAVVVAAPLAGTISLPAPTAGSAAVVDPPAAGARVARGDAVFALTPILTAEAAISLAASRVEAAGDVETATVEVDAAAVALERAEQLLAEKSGSRRDVDEARARHLAAVAALEAARARLELLARIERDPAASAVAVPIPSPLDGVLVDVEAAPGQTVAAGAPLFEVARLERMWVRVPVHAGDAARLDTTREAPVGDLGGAPGGPSHRATPVAGPPSADPVAATVDLYYEVADAGGSLRPGQRVAVTIPLRGEAESLVAPWSAVVHDIHGGAWVYVETAPNTFVRRRVEVRHVAGDLAALASGPEPGARVVVAGAAELFGAEFGVGH